MGAPTLCPPVGSAIERLDGKFDARQAGADVNDVGAHVGAACALREERQKRFRHRHNAADVSVHDLESF